MENNNSIIHLENITVILVTPHLDVFRIAQQTIYLREGRIDKEE